MLSFLSPESDKAAVNLVPSGRMCCPSFRGDLLGRLVPDGAAGAWSLDPHDYELVAEVDRRIIELERAGGDRLECYAADDRELIGRVFLYQIYHRLVPEHDALIRSQLNEPGTSIEVPYARDALAALTQRGADAVQR